MLQRYSKPAWIHSCETYSREHVSRRLDEVISRVHFKPLWFCDYFHLKWMERLKCLQVQTKPWQLRMGKKLPSKSCHQVAYEIQCISRAEAWRPAGQFITSTKDLEQTFCWRNEESILTAEKRFSFSFPVCLHMHISIINNIPACKEDKTIPFVKMQSKITQKLNP